MASELESDLRDTVDWSRKWLVDSNIGKTQLVSFDWYNNTGAIDMKMDGSVLDEKSSFKMLGLTFSSKLDWGSCIISIAKKEVPLYLCKSVIRSCMEYCCHVWGGASNCYLELLDKLQTRICRDVGALLSDSL